MEKLNQPTTICEITTHQIGIWNCPLHGIELNARVWAVITEMDTGDVHVEEGYGQRQLSDFKYSIKWLPFYVK